MIHLLFCNVLYPNIDRAVKIEVVSFEDKKYPCIAIQIPELNKVLTLDVCSHPNVVEILNNASDEERGEVARNIVYQTFNLFCQRFAGKVYTDGKLVEVENSVFNLDGALYSLHRVAEDAKDSESEEIKQ